MEYIDHIEVNGTRGDIAVNKSGVGAPTESTVGNVGQFYMDSATEKVYKCTEAKNGKYTWKPIGGEDSGVTVIKNQDSTNKKPLRSIDSGTYVLSGYFTPYEGSTESYTFDSGMIVAILKETSKSYVQVFYPKSNVIQYLEITDSAVTRKDAKLVNMESVANRVSSITSSSDATHYPSAKAVYEAIQASGVPLTGSTAPTTTTKGVVGQSYFVIVNKAVTDMYVCTSALIGSYTWDKVEFGSTYTLPEASSTELGGIKADSAQSTDTQAVRKGTDGKLYTAPGIVTDAQVSAAVSNYLTEHPEAATTLADGAVTETKLSDDLYKQVMGDARHKLTEVEVTPIPQGATWAKANYDGSTYNMVTTFFTPLTKTPRYIKVVNKSSDTTIRLRSGYNRFRFANGVDETAEGFAVSDGSRNLQFFNDLSVAPGETLLYDLQEYGRKGCEYFQHIVAGKNISGAYTDAQFSEKLHDIVEVYYIYDSYVPTYSLPDDSGEFLMDLPIKYVAQGVNNTKTTRVYAVAPYYPDTIYNVRGGYYPTVNYNTLSVVYLLDDKIFDGRDNGLDFNSGTCGAVPLIKGMYTTQYDTSVNAGRNNAYAWAYHKTPPASELVGPKYIGICFLDFDQDDNVDMGAEYYNNAFDAWNAEGAKNRYVTRFNKQVPRSLYAQLAFPNPNYHDDGSKYYAMLTSASKSPLVGASWVLFGDSLTDNYGGHDMAGNYFATKIAREFNMIFDNRAKSGSNIYRGGSGNYVSVSGMIKLDEFVAEIDAGTTEQPDYITIAFGTNSFTAQLGTNEDTSETDTSVYGATKRFIEVLREKCPKSVFGFVLSPKQNWGTSDPNNLRAVDAARTAIKTVCDDYGVPYIDMSTQSGITVDMLPDGIHISNDQSQNLYYHAMRRFMIGL